MANHLLTNLTVSKVATDVALFDGHAVMDIGESLCQIDANNKNARRSYVELLSSDKILKVMAVTRFHFISGMPTAGADLLTDVLAQNPAVTARSDSSAASVFQELSELCKNLGTAANALDTDSRNALLRGCLDAVHHSRPLASVVFDNNPAWMSMTYELSKLMSLSRFIFVVRDPASIAADLAQGKGAAMSPAALMAMTG